MSRAIDPTPVSSSSTANTASASASAQTSPAASAPPKSAWAKGPPLATTTSTPGSTRNNSPLIPQTQTGASGNVAPNGVPVSTTPVNGNGNGNGGRESQGGHSRKPSLMAIGGVAEGKPVPGGATTKPVNISRGGSSINFGSTNSPDAQLSSSPAQPISTGAHLPQGLKTWGSIDADADGKKAASTTSGVSVGHARKMSNMSGLVIPPFQGGKAAAAATVAAQVAGAPGNGNGATLAQPAPVKPLEPIASAPPKATPPPTTTTSPAPSAAAKKFDVNRLFQTTSPAPSVSPSNAPSATPPPSAIPSQATGSSMYAPSGLPDRRMSTTMHMQQAAGYDAQGRPISAASPFPAQHGHPNQGHPYQVPGLPANGGQHPYANMAPHMPQGQGAFRPPPQQQARSPSMAHQQVHPFNPQQGQYRAPTGPGGGQGQPRGGANAMSPRPQHTLPQGQGGQGMMMGQQGVGNYGMHPSQMGGYPGMYQGNQGGYYAMQGAYAEQQGQYGLPPQWQAQQHPYPGGMPLSPRNGNASISSSPAPSHPGLPASSGPSQSPAISARPSSMVGGPQHPHGLSHSNTGLSSSSSQASMPGTPSQTPARPTSFQPSNAPFTPAHLNPQHTASSMAPPGSPNPSLSVAAMSFTPRAKTVIKFSRPDGTAVDINAAAQAAKTTPSASTAATAASVATTAPETATPIITPAKPILPGIPVVVRLESEAQRASRLAEEEKEKKIKEIERKEEEERKARKAKEAKEQEEKAEKAEKEKKELAEKERLAKEQEAAEAKKAEEEAAELKKKEEAEAAEAARVLAAEKEAARLKEEAEKVEQEAKAKEEALAKEARENTPSLAPPSSEGRRSASASPLASPSLSHASLPPKPTSVLGERKRAIPAALELTPQDSVPGSPVPASASAIITAKNIEDINSIAYPEPLQSPSAALNVGAESGKFRYDRDFLLQFMQVCREKPESMPALEAIGMEADASPSSGFGGGRGGSRNAGNRGSASGSTRSSATGLGIGGVPGIGGRFGDSGRPGMGSFGSMGNFSSTRATTSEERLAASRAASSGFARPGSSSSMARTPSQTGPGAMGAILSSARDSTTTRTRSARGQERKRPEPRAVANSFATPPEPGVAPLELSANRWTPQAQAGRRPGQQDETSPEFVERKVKALLNKLTMEKFESISNQILDWANKSSSETDGQTLRLVIKLIFDKAKDEQFWSSMYAELCRKLQEKLSSEVHDILMKTSEGKELFGGALFRKYLLSRCQEDFEKGWKHKQDTSVAAKNKASEDQDKKAAHEKAAAEGGAVEEFKFSDEYYAEQTAKRQGLGLVKFVGELFKLDMVSAKIMSACVKQLLQNVKDPDDEDVESLCQLLKTAGKTLDLAQPGVVNVYMQRMAELKDSPYITPRIKFMVEDVIELRRAGWKIRNAAANAGPMTIEEVHKAASREQAEAARAAAMAPPGRGGDSISRGGSRRGNDRGAFPGAGGPDGWNTVGNRPPNKAADMSNFGKITSGGPAAFGPSSVFSSKKGSKSGPGGTPPLSRSSSSANLSTNAFGVLIASGDAAADPSSTTGSPENESPAQRKKLILAPRTKQAEGEENDDGEEIDETDEAEEEDEADEEGTDQGTPHAKQGDWEGSELTKADVERKIAADLTELWGVKDTAGTRSPTDIVEYFSYLPEGARIMLASKLVDEVFRIAKKADTEIVTAGFDLAIEQGIISSAIIKESLKSSVELLDDLAVDIPQAYKFTAAIIVAGKLSEDDYTELADSIEVFGEPARKPKDILLEEVSKALEASA